jgi:Pectic acid lyase
MGLVSFVLANLVSRFSSAEDSKASHAEPTVEEAKSVLLKAAKFFQQSVAVEGGYVFRYSSDLKFSEGEEATGNSTVWIEPPATPAVGMAYLRSYQATGEPALLQAAKDTAQCLIRGQLKSGGWDNRIEFGKQERSKYAYRVDGTPSPKARNVTTLDDDKTQSAIRFLASLDQELGFKDKAIHEASIYALESLVSSQYPNGAWPQRYTGPTAKDEYPIVASNYPKTWPSEYPNVDYTQFYTLNDDTLVDTLTLMLDVGEIYQEDRYRKSALQAGEFLLLAQMPDPQPAWAQQYNHQMQPVWARKFEPPAISGSESQKVIDVLLLLYQHTGDARFMQSAQRALDYLETCVLPSGKIARFQELKTNRPLYCDRQYKLTYDDSDLPTHYGFIVDNKLEKVGSKLQKLAEMSKQELKEYADRQQKSKKFEKPDMKKLKAAISTIDDRGAWVQEGKLSTHKGKDLSENIIETKTFIANLDSLSRFIATQK